MLRKKTLEPLTKKKLIIIMTKRNQEGPKRKRKNNEEHCSNSFYSYVKNGFRLVGRN